MTMSTAIHNIKRIGDLGSIEAAGIRMGVGCAKEILEKPEVSALGIVALYLSKAQAVNDEFRRTGDLTDDGEAAFRKGFDRGLQSQMANPDAKIEIKAI